MNINSAEQESTEAIGQIFNASSVAIIGASGNPRKYGYMTLETLLRGGYRGRIYPVNPRGGEILGLKVYPSLNDLPEVPDLGVILVPYQLVVGVLKEAVALGMPGVVITTSGFSEAGRTVLQEEVARIAEDGNLRIIGPNTEGFIYTPSCLHAQFYPVVKNSGRLAIITQSGSLSNSLIGWANNEELGLSACISLGNQVDLSEVDFIRYLADDLNTGAIILHLEGISDGRRFIQVLNDIRGKKPLVILKAGRTATGYKSVASHTASLAGSNEVFSAVCSQFGAEVVDDIQSLYDYGKALSLMKAPCGNRLVVISSSGGLGILAVDEAESLGLTVPEIPAAIVDELKQIEFANPVGSLCNPIDLATIWIEEFEKVALLLDSYDLADIFLFNFGDPIPGAGERLIALSRKIKAGIILSYMGGEEEEIKDKPLLHRAGIPVMQTPERAVRAAAAVIRYAETERNLNSSQVLNYRLKERKPFADDLKMIPENEAIELLQHYGVCYPQYGLAASVEEAVSHADVIGYPVVMKIVSQAIIHKSDIGGVIINLGDAKQVTEGYQKILSNAATVLQDDDSRSIMVCKQAEMGLELIIGGLEDPVFGPTVMFGLGGIFSEVLNDVSFRAAPLRRIDALKMIQEIRGFPILSGARGRPSCDIESITELLLSISRLLLEHPEIKELDLNPVRIYGKSFLALDARIIKWERRNDHD